MNNDVENTKMSKKSELKNNFIKLLNKANLQTLCLVFDPINVNNFASLFNCMPVGRASDSIMAPTYS